MRTIGKYEILGLLGKGGMGAVYKVRLPGAGRIMALKLLAPREHLVDLLGDDEVTRRFMDEARALGELEHPNIVRVCDCDEHRGRPFFVMEHYCDDLSVLIGEADRVEAPTRRLRLPRAVSYARQTLAGLARLHHAGIVHRDIKPGNLLITDADRIKIADFGLSAVRGRGAKGPRSLKIGSPFYCAPEQERDPAAAGPPADLFSASVTFERLLTGLIPKEPGQRTTKPSRLNADLDADWDAFFEKGRRPNPKDRFQSAKDMLAALDALFSAWSERIDAVCRLEEGPEYFGKHLVFVRPAPGSLRAGPLKVGPAQARQAFAVDMLARPKPYLENDFADNGDATVSDAASGLMWQKGGSEYPVNYAEARDHVWQLNETAFAGYADWRLPTIAELLSLIRPEPKRGGHCLPPALDPVARRLWSADARSHVSGWFADVDTGFIGFADHTCRLGARAVRRA
jgi:serine/threonine-protein kinase